jgi:hypothetical protein
MHIPGKIEEKLGSNIDLDAIHPGCIIFYFWLYCLNDSRTTLLTTLTKDQVFRDDVGTGSSKSTSINFALSADHKTHINFCFCLLTSKQYAPFP